jgi:hypothetical protein
MRPDERQLAAAKGRNLKEVMRELSHNATLSLLSDSIFRYVPSLPSPPDPVQELSRPNSLTLTASPPNPPSRPITYTKPVNIYTYAPFKLFLAVITGLSAHLSNGHSARYLDRTFSSFLFATRNPELDGLVLRSRGEYGEVDEKLEKTRLRYGIVRLEGDGDGKREAALEGFKVDKYQENTR